MPAFKLEYFACRGCQEGENPPFSLSFATLHTGGIKVYQESLHTRLKHDLQVALALSLVFHVELLTFHCFLIPQSTCLDGGAYLDCEGKDWWN